MQEVDTSRSSRWFWPLALVVVTLLALALRWYYVSTAVVYHPIRGDAIQYHAYAWNLAHHGVFARGAADAIALTPDNYRDPGYPLFLAIWMKLLGDGAAWYAAVLLCQALLGALTVTMAMQLGRRWLPAGWAIGAGVLMAVWPHSVTIDSFLLTETLFGFLCALAMLVCARACDRESPGWGLAAGLAFGAAALTNAVLLPFGILLAAFMAWRKLVSRKVWIALAIGAVLLPGAWAIRNTQIAAPPIADSSTGRALQNLVQGSWPLYHSAWKSAIVHGDSASQRILQDIDHEYLLLQASPTEGARLILHRLGQHPLRYLDWYLFEKPRLLWGWNIRIGQGDIYVFPTVNSPFRTHAGLRALAAICHILNPLLALFALASVFMLLVRKRKANAHNGHTMLEVTTTLLVFVTLVYTTLQAEPRYSIPFRAFEMLLAITTIYWVTLWLRMRKQVDMGSDSQPSNAPGVPHSRPLPP